MFGGERLQVFACGYGARSAAEVAGCGVQGEGAVEFGFEEEEGGFRVMVGGEEVEGCLGGGELLAREVGEGR